MSRISLHAIHFMPLSEVAAPVLVAVAPRLQNKFVLFENGRLPLRRVGKNESLTDAAGAEVVNGLGAEEFSLEEVTGFTAIDDEGAAVTGILYLADLISDFTRGRLVSSLESLLGESAVLLNRIGPNNAEQL